MNKSLLSALCLAATLASHAQTATDFTCSDCAGNTHNLFTELDAGHVVVIAWVMPCGACIGPALTTYNVVQSYQTTHPDGVRMYLCDDYANTNCNAINSWKNAQGLTNTTTFSNANISMADYGGPGMPKVVVLGGPGHTVFYNANNMVNAAALQNGIDAALAAVGVEEASMNGPLLQVAPVPADHETKVSFALDRSEPVVLDLYNLAGTEALTIQAGTRSPGTHQLIVPVTQLPAGAYVLRLTVGTERAYQQVVVGH